MNNNYPKNNSLDVKCTNTQCSYNKNLFCSFLNEKQMFENRIHCEERGYYENV